MAARCFICGEIFPFPAFIGIPVRAGEVSPAVCSPECLQDYERLGLAPDAGSTCSSCKGTGIDPRDVDVPCSNCKGFGDERALDGIDLN